MSDTNGEVPEVPVKPARRSFLERLSIVWVIPVIALAIALGVAWQTWYDRGPVIEIAFDNASGVAANETELRYRDVAVGVVEQVTFTDSLDKVLVSVRLNKDVAPYVDADAQFWVVRPEVSAEGVTGLDTVLTGVFIEGIWDTERGQMQDRYTGLSEAPLTRDGRRGLAFRLRASGDAALTENAPILYRGIEVGRIGRAEVSNDGSTVEADAIVFEPHDRLISTSTRFWDTSGFTFKLGPNGAEIDFSSVASLIAGGVTFRTVVSGGAPVEQGALFTLFPDEGAARSSLFSEEDGEALNLTAIFEENVSGLAVESPVDLGGLRIGQVTALNGIVDEERFGDRRVRLAATISIRPSRLGLAQGATPDEALNFLDRRVAEGLRARLTTASLLTGGLKVELIEVPDAPEQHMDLAADPNPLLPTTDSEISDVAATAEGVFERINALPIEELLESAIGLMDNTSRLIGSEDVRAVPGEVLGLLADARGVIGSEQIQALPERIAGVVTEVETLVTALNDSGAVDRVLETVDAAGSAAEAVSGSVEGIPALVARIEAVAAKAEALPIEDTLADLGTLIRSAEELVGNEAVQAVPVQVVALLNEVRALIASPGVQALPGQLNVVVTRLDTLLAQLNEEEAPARLVAAVNDAAAAARSVSSAVEGVPALVQRMDGVAQRVQELPLDRLADELADLLVTAEDLIGTEEAKALPGDLSAALDELRLVLADLREGGVVENANATFASARRAADDISTAARDLPGLIDRIQVLLAQTGETIRGYDSSNGVGRDVEAALREVQRAASAVSSLARALERNPNSLLFGR